jgi:hypothetical protein
MTPTLEKLKVDMTKLLAAPVTELDLGVQSETSPVSFTGAPKDSTAFLEHVAEQW